MIWWCHGTLPNTAGVDSHRWKGIGLYHTKLWQELLIRVGSLLTEEVLYGWTFPNSLYLWWNREFWNEQVLLRGKLTSSEHLIPSYLRFEVIPSVESTNFLNYPDSSELSVIWALNINPLTVQCRTQAGESVLRLVILHHLCDNSKTLIKLKELCYRKRQWRGHWTEGRSLFCSKLPQVVTMAPPWFCIASFDKILQKEN